MGPGTSHYVPTNAVKFTDHNDILKILATGIKHNLPVLLIGESGTGKTSAIRYLAGLTQNGLRRVNLNGGTTADELVGRLLAKDGSTYWVDGILTEAMRNGDWIVLDEINAALPEVLFVLQSVMDDDGYLVLTEKDDKEIVRKHPNFRLFATCNPPEYAGTKEMNKALLSRFPICINAEYPPEKKELEIIANHLGNAIAGSELAGKLVGLARETRAAKENGKTDYAINTRDILNTLRLASTFSPAEAVALAFGNKLESSDGKALKSLARMHLPTVKVKKTGELKPITSAQDIMLGSTYVVDADVHGVLAGITNDKKKIKNFETETLGSIISGTDVQGVTKGDRFLIKGYCYAQIDGISQKEENDEKAATLVEILSGPNKDKHAILLHHVEVQGTEAVLKHLYEEV